MAEFEARIYRLTIEPHPNADALEIAKIGDYRSIVRKGQYTSGQLGVYIPEQAVLPSWLITALGLEGRLAGKAKNRVKAVKLRGVLSQGLVYPVKDAHVDGAMRPTDAGPGSTVTTYVEFDNGQIIGVGEGDVVTEFLGITKYEPVIPTSMSGEVRAAAGCTLKYDIENIKKYPDVLSSDEPVYVTEKLHGTWCCFGFHPDVEHPVVTSKGLSAQGLCFKFNETNAEKNLYVRTFNSLTDESGTLLGRAGELLSTMFEFERGIPFYILGEIYGPGVQDLHYGEKQAKFRAFDLFVGEPSSGDYVGSLDKERFFKELGIEQVPVLYRGPFDRSMIEELTNGKETVSGSSANVREGVVITPIVECTDNEIGRVILKSVSEDYLLRKGNTTEYN